jgi:hypothetical protein
VSRLPTTNKSEVTNGGSQNASPAAYQALPHTKAVPHTKALPHIKALPLLHSAVSGEAVELSIHGRKQIAGFLRSIDCRPV